MRLRRLLGARPVSIGRRALAWLRLSPCFVQRFALGGVPSRRRLSCLASSLSRSVRASVVMIRSNGGGAPVRLVSVGGSRRRILLLARRIRAPPLLEMVVAHALAASWVRRAAPCSVPLCCSSLVSFSLGCFCWVVLVLCRWVVQLLHSVTFEPGSVDCLAVDLRVSGVLTCGSLGELSCDSVFGSWSAHKCGHG